MLRILNAALFVLVVPGAGFSADYKIACGTVFGGNTIYEGHLTSLREFDKSLVIDAKFTFPKQVRRGEEPLIGSIYFGKWNHADRGVAQLATPREMSIRVERHRSNQEAFWVTLYFDDRLRSYSFSIPFSAIDQAKNRPIVLQIEALTNVPTGPMAPMLQYSGQLTLRLEGATALPIKEVVFNSVLPSTAIWPGLIPKTGYSDGLRIDFSRLTISETSVSSDPFERAPNGEWSEYTRSDD